MDRTKQPTVYKLKIGCVAAVTVLLLLMLEPAAVLSSMQRSLQLCAGTVIPSLFPFLVASELLVSSGAGERLASKLSAPICAVFGVSRCGAVAYVMGLLCGFPIGARTAASYAKRGKISRDELEQLLCFCNVPSAAFVINAVGMSLYGDIAFGRFLWGISLLAAALVGVGYRFLYRKSAKREQAPQELDANDGAGGTLGSALVNAAGGMLSVVATVLFFGAVLGALNAVLLQLWRMTSISIDARVTTLISGLLSCFFELTGGVAAAASLLQAEDVLLRALSPLICAAAVGWGGLSVHYQLFSACDGYFPRLRMGRFFMARLMQALLCVVGVMLYVVLRSK
ncbi:MAG: hypothetical protein IJW40_10375 [Clostridia bacterium]|nr:hypothetical protein [Clostridia bacterium]